MEFVPNYTQVKILLLFLENYEKHGERALSPTYIAKRTKLSPGGIVKAMKKLIEYELVEYPQRGIYIVTDKGLYVARKLKELMVEQV